MCTKSSNPATLKLNDPLRLAVAAAIAYPDGSMTAKGLRREAKRGNLVKESLRTDCPPKSNRNTPVIRTFARGADKVVLCFGAIHRKLQHHAIELVDVLQKDGIALSCLGTTKAGFPRHPLYLKSGTPLIPF